MVRLKRIYEEPEKSDSFRILVDRLWPRGVSKNKAHIDLWLKEIGPSNELRKWFNHDQVKWSEFKKKYKKELKRKRELLNTIKVLYKKHKNITLLYGAKDENHNQAIVIKEILANFSHRKI